MSDFDYVAEHVMGFERQRCQGTFGGGGLNATGPTFFFYCDWCWQRYDDRTTSPPCPRYPFPSFSLRDLMKRLGEMGYHSFVRYDPVRNQNNWTVLFDESRIADTDDPLKAFCYHLQKEKVGAIE